MDKWWGEGQLLQYASSRQAMLYELLDERIVGQEHVKKIVAQTMYVIESQIKSGISSKTRSNLLFIGPPGSGKTYVAETMAQVVNVPMARAPLTRYSKTGYVGDTFIESLRAYVDAVISFERRIHPNKKSWNKLYYDSTARLHGIMFYDEIDKLVNVESTRGDIIGTVQDEMLDILQGTIVEVKMDDWISRGVEVDTRNMTFICAGAFSGLEKIIGKNTGMGEKTSRSALYEHLTSEHLLEYGIKSELFRRVPNVLIFNELRSEQMIAILKNQHSSPFVSKENMLKNLYGVKLIIEEPVYEYVAQLSQKDKTLGVGALEQVANLLTGPILENPKTYAKRMKIIVNLAMAKEFLREYENKKLGKRNVGFENKIKKA